MCPAQTHTDEGTRGGDVVWNTTPTVFTGTLILARFGRFP
jgi:hypothetical protein